MNPTKLFKAIGILIITLVILAALAVCGYAIYLETHYFASLTTSKKPLPATKKACSK